MRKLALPLFVLALIGGLSGGGLIVYSAYQRGIETRGWVDPATDGNLPFHQPLPGINVDLRKYSPDRLPQEVAAIARAGFIWVRQPFYWAEIEPEKGRWDFDAYDRIVSAIRSEPRLRIVAVLESSPAWARRPDARDVLQAPPASMDHFAGFARALAARYADQIDHYQIWDEPNLFTNWGGLDPRPADYAAMLAAAYPAIKANDLDATVIAAGLAPTVETGPRNLSDTRYLRALYEVGAADWFDAAAGKPYGFNTGPLDRTVNEAVLNFSRLILLREIMVEYGDGRKPLWGSHFGWNHLPADWTGRPSIWGSVSAEQQREYTRQAYARAAREWPWMGGLILAFWSPNAPADDPIQGFAVSGVAESWLEGGRLFEPGGLGVGLHHPTDPRITYGGAWRRSLLGADVQLPELPPHTLQFQFSGRSLGFTVRRDNYLAYLYVQIDNQPANSLPQEGSEGYLVLRSATLDARTETIRAAAGLPDGVHQATVRAYLGYDRWLLAGIGVGDPPDTRPFDGLLALGAALIGVGLIGAGMSVRAARREGLIRLGRGLAAYVRRLSGFLIGLIVSVIGALSMALTINDLLPAALRRDSVAIGLAAAVSGALYLSPSVITSVLALIALFLLVYNRPLIGLGLVVFWAPFFLAPIDLHVWALPMVELSLLISVAAAVLRRILGLAETVPSNGRGRLYMADWGLIALVGFGVLSLLWSAQINQATRELRIVIVEPVLFYLLLRRANLTRREWALLADVFLLAGAAVSAYGLITFVTGTGGVGFAEQGVRRLMSVYRSPNNLALFLGRCIPMGAAFVLIAPGRIRKAIAAVLTGIMLAAAALTQSAGAALLGLPAGLAVVLLVWNWRRGVLVIGLMTALGIASLPILSQIPRLAGILDLSRASSLVRTQLWEATFSLIREQPITGVGLDQFLYAYRSRYILPEAWAEPDLSHPHNIVLDFWSRLGIGGVLALTLILGGFWRAAFRAQAAWRRADRLMLAVTAGAMGGVANVMAHGLVDNSYFVTDLAFVLCFLVAVAVVLGNPASQETTPSALTPVLKGEGKTG